MPVFTVSEEASVDGQSCHPSPISQPRCSAPSTTRTPQGTLGHHGCLKVPADTLPTNMHATFIISGEGLH